MVTEYYKNKDGDYPVESTSILDTPKKISGILDNILDSKVSNNGHSGIRSSLIIVPFDEAEDIRAKNCQLVMREYKDPCSCIKNHNKSRLQKLTDFIFKR